MRRGSSTRRSIGAGTCWTWMPGTCPRGACSGSTLLAAGRPDEAIVELTAAAGPRQRRSDFARVARARQGACRRSRGGRCHRREARSGAAERLRAVPTISRLRIPVSEIATRRLAQLEKACAEREPAVINLKVEPRFEPLRRDARYGALLQRLNLQTIGLRAGAALVLCHTAALNSQLNRFDFHGFTRRSFMTARRIVVAVLALASLTVGMYAQGRRRRRAGRRPGEGGGGRPCGRRPAGRPVHLSPAT